jgi:hypothetical protein
VGMTRRRRSTGVSGSSSPTLSGCWSPSRRAPRPSRTATAPRAPCWACI